MAGHGVGNLRDDADNAGIDEGEMNTVPMSSSIDCGRCSASNHVAAMTGKDARALYEQTAKFKQPSFMFACDFWDSPTRQLAMIADLSGKPAGLVPFDPFVVPCTVLIRKGLMAWHWVTVLTIGNGGSYRLHDGEREFEGVTIEQRFPETTIALACAIGGTGKLSWLWKLWGTVSWPIRKF